MVIKMKKGQVNMFIIAGVAIVVVIALLLFYRGKLLPDLEFGREKNPNIFFESCIEGKIKEVINLMSSQGGYTEPELKIRFKFEGKDYANIPYLCYTSNYYVPCINQEPMLIKHLNDEIKDYIKDDVETCFNDYTSELAKQGYQVNSSYNGFELELLSKRILVNIDGKITTEKTEETSKQENFEVAVPTMFYDLAVITQEIVSQEAEFCNFEQVGFMLLNPKLELDKFKTGDSDTIYKLKHRDSKEEFQFAVRGCVIPPGM